MAALFDLVIMTVSSAPGVSATISLGGAATVNGVTYLSFSNAGTPAGTSIAYSILDTAASELGTATYLSSGPLLGSRTPTKSTNGNAAINASSAAIILCGPRSEDIISTDLAQSFTAAQQAQVLANIAAARLTNATLQANASNPFGTVATVTPVMMGLGTTFHITPVYSSRVKAEIACNLSNTVSGAITEVQLAFGTGTAPTNGATATGTTIGANKDYTAAGVGGIAPVTLVGIVTGLTPGTAYWFDVQALVSAGTGTITAVSCTLMEF